MKLAIIFAVAFVALLNSETANGSPFNPVRSRRDTDLQVCEPGDTKMEDCNSCFCVADGSGWSCTRMECIHSPVNVQPAEDAEQNDETDNYERAKRQAVNGPGSRCRPSTHFRDCDYSRYILTRATLLEEVITEATTYGGLDLNEE